MTRVRLALLLCGLAACTTPKKAPTGTPPESFCPGAPGCEQGANGTLQVGIAARTVSPTAYERPRPDYLKNSGEVCPEGAPHGTDGQPRCGELKASAFHDCGLDTLCPGDVGYPGKDSGEADGHPDWFFDCGRDQVCPGDPGYTAPDADGSEGDDTFQGFWLAGFGNNIPLYAVHDDQQARAVVLENGDVTLGVVSVDTIGLFRDDVLRIRARAAQKLPAGALDYLLVSSTHTHEAPDTLGQFGMNEGLIPTKRGVDDAWLTQVLIENTAQAVADAWTSRRPAKLTAAQGHLGSRTREVISDTRDPFVHDDAVTVLEFTEAQSGDVIGTLVSWGNHPETVADVNNALTADFAWALREGMENGVFKADGSLVAQGRGGTCVFLQGAVGGMQTSLHADPLSVDGVHPRARSFEKARAVGNVVALTALESLAQATPQPAPPLAYGAQTLLLPVENDVFQLLFTNLTLLKRRLYDFNRDLGVTATNIPHVQTEVAKLQVGGVRFLAVPGELLPELAVGYDAKWAFGGPQVREGNVNPPDLSKVPAGPYLKDQLHGEVNCVVGLANDELGYLIPPYDYQVSATKPFLEQAPGNHYEETNSLGPSATPKLLEAYGTLLGWEPTP